MTNAERVAYAGLEEGRFCLETDTDLIWIGTAGGDSQVNGAAGTTTYWNPDALPAVPSAQDDHFKAGALDVKWTEFDPAVAKITVTTPDTFLKIEHATEAVDSHRGVYQTLPAGDFTIVAKASIIGNAVDDNCVALCLFEDAADPTKQLVVHKLWFRTDADHFRDILIERWTDYDTYAALYSGHLVYPSSTTYLRIRRNATDIYFEYSDDGVSWQMLYTRVQPFAPAHMGIVTVNDNTGLTIYGYVDLFRYIASDQIGPIGKLE